MRFVEIPLLDDKGESIFPERFNNANIEDLKVVNGPYLFSCNYMMNPVSPEDQVFRKEWIRYYNAIPQDLVIIISVDPASRRKKSSDYTAMMVHGYTVDGKWYILDIVKDKLLPADRVNKVFELVDKWEKRSQRPIRVVYETIGFQDTDSTWIKNRQLRLKKYFQIDEISSHKGSKIDRIKGLQPMYAAGMIHWLPNMRFYSTFLKREIDVTEQLRMEYSMFPKAVHDDLMDVHCFPLSLNDFRTLRAKPIKKKPKIPEICLFNIRQRQKARKQGIKEHLGWR